MKINKNLTVLCTAMLAAGLGGCSSDDSPAPTIACYAADGSAATSGSLYKVNMTDGTMTTVGAIGHSVTGMAFQGATLYAVESDTRTNTTQLITIDTSTGAGTVVGPLDGGGVTGHTIADIAFLDGVLYGWTELSDDFVTIDPATGAVTVIPSAYNSWGDGMAALNGELYFIGQSDASGTGGDADLATLNPADGIAVATIGKPTYVVAGTCGALNSMTAYKGMLYGFDTDCLGLGANNTSLVSVNPADATMTEIANYPSAAIDAIACN